MNDRAPASATDSQQVAVDAEHPWLGLASFTEETRAYFYGREEEVAELGRRVQRKLLTILFGQSGLGKTSILRAGIVPRLRPEGYCPVYVRVDYSPDSPPPSEQIKQAIFRATQASGEWTQTGVAETGESLWEFLHHRDDVLRDASGKTLIPLLIFDQFEELFTLAQSDDFGRQRAAQFIEDLADLVENRAPKALEAKMDEDEAAVERFDFTRGDYRILIALREDYLAHLEGLKGAMPSISQNRMRLARMTGTQALSAVMKPGGKLVSEEVAGSIVRFVAGGAELANAEVEPALLSLICRELNNARLSQGRSEISADLLAGSRDTILTEFYERALADQPLGVRQFIEDNLLTESGYRESLAEERVKKGLAAAGATPHALADLVNRRLLRIEERLDVRRVELTHDVLCGVVRASRDVRLERDARADIERKLAAQRERELATRKALVRARQIATVCGVLAILSVASAIFGYVSMKRAQVAESEAQQTRLLAESARGEAEKLVVYLLDDFYLELEPVGRLDIVAALAKRAIAYYDALPAQLRTPETERNRALALVRYGSVLRYQANLVEGQKVLTEAIGVLDRLRKDGDQSEITAIGLALGLAANARTADSQARYADSTAFISRAVDVLTPLMNASTPSIPLRRAYGNVMTYAGFARLNTGDDEGAVKNLDAARDAYRGIDGLKFTDLPSAAGYAEASAWQMNAYGDLGRTADVVRVGEEVAPIAARILEQRPAHMGALRARGLIGSTLADTFGDNFQLKQSLVYGDQSTQAWEAFLKLDPGNTIAWNNLAGALSHDGFALYALGRVDEARAKLATNAAIEKRTKVSASFVFNLMFGVGKLASIEADLGHPAEAQAWIADLHNLAQIARAGLGGGSPRVQATLKMFEAGFVAALPIAAHDYLSVRRILLAALPDPSLEPSTDPRSAFIWNINMAYAQWALADAEYNVKNYADAEKAARKAIAANALLPQGTNERKRFGALAQTTLAMTLARLDRRVEAQQAVAPALKLHREYQVTNKEDLTERIEFAQTLYASALTGSGKQAAELAEAAATIDALPVAMRHLKTTQFLREEIAEEQASRRK